MNIQKKYCRIFLLIGLLSNAGLYCETAEKKDSVNSEKARKHARAIEKKYKVKVADQAFLDSLKKNEVPKADHDSSKAPSLTPEEIRKIAFSVIPNEDDESEEIIDDKVIEKLLLMGSSDQRDFFLKTVFNGHIATGFGATQAMLTLSNPTTNTSTLHNRQQAISILAQDKSLIELIAKQLNQIGEAEKKSLLPFQTEKRILGENKSLPQIPNILPTEWNKSPGLIDAVEIGKLGITSFLFPISIYLVANAFLQYQNTISSKKNTLDFLHQAIPNLTALTQGTVGAYKTYDHIKTKINDTQICNQPRDMLLETKKHIIALQTLSSLINQNQELLTQIPSLQSLAHFNNQEKHSQDLKNLLYILNNHNFEGENSFFYRQGPAIAAYYFKRYQR